MHFVFESATFIGCSWRIYCLRSYKIYSVNNTKAYSQLAQLYLPLLCV